MKWKKSDNFEIFLYESKNVIPWRKKDFELPRKYIPDGK